MPRENEVGLYLKNTAWFNVASEKCIKINVARLAKQITEDYKGLQPIYAVCILNGGTMFFADLIRQVNLQLETGYIHASSYEDEQQLDLNINYTMLGNVQDKHAIIIDDIYDTGQTIEVAGLDVKLAGAKTVRSCTLLLKEREHEREITPNYYGMVVPEDRFYVGYGMDYKGLGRNFPFIVSKEKDKK